MLCSVPPYGKAPGRRGIAMLCIAWLSPSATPLFLSVFSPLGASYYTPPSLYQTLHSLVVSPATVSFSSSWAEASRLAHRPVCSLSVPGLRV